MASRAPVPMASRAPVSPAWPSEQQLLATPDFSRTSDAELALCREQLSRSQQQKAGREQDAADAKGDLADTTATRKEDQKYLNDLTAQCDQKTRDYESRQTLRGELSILRLFISYVRTHYFQCDSPALS